MANVRVAVRVRPLSKRETKEGGRIIVEVDGNVAKIRNLKVDSRPDSFGDSREKIVAFSFDYCYWSVNPEDPQYASQDVVFQDLGTEVLSGAAKGYNICLFAYGQTGSGKTYTMLGTPASVGLTPRICEGLFLREEDCTSLLSSYRITVSFLEIYNERVRDLLKQSDQKKSYILKVREHPEMGPYVQGLSQHAVTNYQQVIQLLEEGIANRITAATHVHEASSRSHAIFTIHYTQANLENKPPLEIASKINLVDLAGSERADPSYCKDRITEGANINKSLVTLGIVISTLAQNSQVFSSCQNFDGAASNGGDSSPSGTSSVGGSSRRQPYIPYRDSVLTWLLKDSLGGNSKTIMVATVSPAHTSYSETMSTLRYASNAKNIVNMPRVNEDVNVKLIRELREEIQRLKAMLLSFELRNFGSVNDKKDENLKKKILQNESKMDELTKDWNRKWNEWQAFMDHYSVDINKRRAGVVIGSSLPHLMALEDDVLSTGVVLYHLKEGTTKIGRIDSDQEQDIVLQGQWIERDHCTITSTCGIVILRPTLGARCTVNGREVTASCRLTQGLGLSPSVYSEKVITNRTLIGVYTAGAVITLGKAQKFRFNHPAEAALLRQQRQVGEAVGDSGSLEWLDLDGDVMASRLGLCPKLWKERRVLEEQCDKNQQLSRDGETSDRAQKQQQCYVENLKQIFEGQIRAQKELEFEQTFTSQQIKDSEQWLIREETWPASLPQQQQQEDCGKEKEREASVVSDAWLRTPLETPLSPLVRSQKRVVQPQILGKHAFWAAERKTRPKKVSFQLERIIKKRRRLLASHRRLELLRTLCGPQDDSAPKSPFQVSSPHATVPGPQRRSRWTSCSFLSLQRLCIQYLPQLHSVFLNGVPSTVLPPLPDTTHQKPEKTPSVDPVHQFDVSPPRPECLDRKDLRSSGWGQRYPAREASARKGASIPGACLAFSHKSLNSQEIETVGKQPCHMTSQGLETLYQSANKLKPKYEQRIFTPTNQTRRTKGLAASGDTQAGWKKERSLGTHKSAQVINCQQAAGHGKAAKSFQAESKPPLPSRVPRRHQRLLAAKVRDIAKKFSHLPHGSPLKRQPSAGNPDTASLTDFSPVVDCAREKGNDLSETDSNDSVDSLSYVYAKVPMELLTLEDLQGKQDLPEPANSESDSQISEDSLADKGYQSPKESPRDGLPINHHGRLRTRAVASVKGFPTLPDSGPQAQGHRSFSLDSLIDAEEALGEERQEEPFLASADERPTETFWHLQSVILPAVGQEATCRSGPIKHRAGARPNTILPMDSSFYLPPQFQPHCEQPESEVEASYSEQVSPLQCMQLARESPIASMDSWFSCDSKINPGSPLGLVGSFCSSPNIKEVQPCVEERPRYWINIEEVKPSDTETILPYNSKLPQGSAELPCGAGDKYTTPTSEASKPSVWETQRLLPPEADDIFQSRGIPDTTQQGTSEGHNSPISCMQGASAASATYVGTVRERDWAALQQKYLLELSHSVLEASGKPPFLEADPSSQNEASDKVDTQLPGAPALSSNLYFNCFSVPLSKTRRLKAEREQDNLNARLESASDFFSTSEKEVSCSGDYSADLESLSSGSTNAQVYAAGNKIPNSMAEACEVKQDSLEKCFQGSKKHGPMTSTDQYFFQKASHNNVTITTKADPWPQDQAPGSLRKNIAAQPGQLTCNMHCLLQRGKTDHQDSSKEVVERHAGVSSAFPSGPEWYLHSAPWNPLPSSMQPPPLETFYVTKSRDALTETALEIPAYREVQPPSPPLRESWGFGHNHQVLQKAHLKNNLPVLPQSQSSKITFSQLVNVAKRPTDLNTSKELGKCPENIKEKNYDSAYSFVAQNRPKLPSTSIKPCEFENQVGLLNKEPCIPALKEGEKADGCGRVSLDSSGSGKTFLFIYECEAGGEERDQNAVIPQIQACSIHRQFSSGAYKTASLGLQKDIPGATAVSLKSKLVCCQVSSSANMALSESPTHMWEGRDETALPDKALPKDSTEECRLPGTESTYAKFQSIPCSQERNPNECKGWRRSQEIINSKEETLGKKPNTRVNNADEMARLIRSVVQLENGILEIESKQNQQLRASQLPGVSGELVFQDLKDHGRADHIPMLGSSSKAQPSSPQQMDDSISRKSEAGEMVGNSATCNDPQVQKSTPGSFRSSEYAQESLSMREQLARDTCDLSWKSTALRRSTSTFLHPRRKTLARALTLHPRLERSSEDGELLKASTNPKEQPWDLQSLEELETVQNCQESQIAEHVSSSESKDTQAQGGIEEITIQREGSLEEENNILSLTKKLRSPSQRCKGAFFSQETVSLLMNQTDFSTATSHQEPSSALPLHSPRPPRSHLHTSNTKGISSVAHMLDSTVLNIQSSHLATGVGLQDQSGETGNCSPQGNTTGASMAHTAWCESAVPIAMGPDDQSVTLESVPLGTKDWTAAGTSLQDQRGDLEIISVGLNTQEAFVHKIKGSSLNRVSKQTEKRVSFILEEGNSQGGEARQTAEEAADQRPASSACLAPDPLLRVPDPEPRLPDSSAHASICLAILNEIRQVKAQKQQLNDFAACGPVFPHYEPGCFSEANSGPQWQMDHLVSDRSRNEGEIRGLHVTSVSDTSPCVLADESTQAATLCHSWAFSHTAPDLDKRHCAEEPRHFLGASKQFTCHSSSSEVIEKKKETLRILSPEDLLAPDRLLSSPAEEQDRRAGSFQSSYNDPIRTLHGQSRSAAWETAMCMSSGYRDGSPEHREPKSLDSTCGKDSGNILMPEQEGKTVHFESQSVVCDAHNSASLSGPKQDHAQCPEASTGLEEGRASPEQCATWPGALRKVQPEAPAWQHVQWKSIRSGLTEACRTGCKSPRPTPLPDQRPSLGPSGVTEEAPGQCPKEVLNHFVFSGSTEDHRLLASSSEEGRHEAMPCSQLCDSQPVVANSCFSHTLCYKDGDLKKGTSKAAPHPVHSPFRVPSRACEMDEIRESSSKVLQGLLAHDLEDKGVNVSTLEPSATVAKTPQGCSPLLITDVRTRSLTCSAAGGSSRSVGGPEEKTAEKKASTDLEAVPFPEVTYPEPPRTLKDSFIGPNARAFQAKPLVATEEPHALNLSDMSVESELVVEAQHRCLKNTTKHLSEKTQPSTEIRSHSYTDPQAKFVAKLKHICRPQVDSSWEEEEQQRDQASAGGAHSLVGNPVPSDEGGLDGCKIPDAKREEGPVTRPSMSQTYFPSFQTPASLPLGQTEAPQAAALRPGQLCFDREQQAPHHRSSLPVISVFSGPKPSKSSLRPQFSGVGLSRSLQELNLGVEPPTPTAEGVQGPDRPLNPPLRDYSSAKSVPRTSPETEDDSQKGSSHSDSGLAGHSPLKPVTPPYPTCSTISCMPTPKFMTNCMSGTLQQAHQEKSEKLCDQGRPENWHSQVNKGMLHFCSSDVNPCVPPCYPQGPVHIGWKQYVFGNAVDVSSSQKPHGLLALNVAQCSSIDSGLDENSLLCSHLSTHAKTQDQSSTCSSIENVRSSNETWQVWNSSFALRDAHNLMDPEGVAPILGPDNRPPFKGPANEAGCPRSELPLAEGSSAAPVGEIVLLYPTEAGCPGKQARTNTFEQGTQTRDYRIHRSCTDIPAQSDAITMSACELASWASMHNLSLHLSQLLHSTSELLGSLSQPSVAKKEQNSKSDSPREAPQALMMDGATQTTVDAGIQTDLTSPPLPLQAPQVKPQEADVILEVEVPESGIMAMSQEKRDVSGALQKREEGETAWKITLPDLHGESTHYRPQNPPVPSLHLKAQKASLGQILPFVIPSASDASLPLSTQLEDSCLVVSSPIMSRSLGRFLSTSELTQETSVQRNLGLTSALLVDRASSPIFTLSASTQELGSSLACLTISAPSAHSLEGQQKLDISSDLAVGAPKSPKESNGSQRAESLDRESKSPLERSTEKLFLESGSQQSSSLQGNFLGQLQPRTTTQVQSRLPSSPSRDRSQRLDDSFVPEKVTSLEHGAPSSKGPSQWQGRPASGVESSTFPVELQPALELSSPWRGLQPVSPSEEGLQDSALGPSHACQPVGLPCSHMCVAPDVQNHSLRDLPVHNKFSSWCGVQDGPPEGLCEELGASPDPSSGDQGQRLPQPSDDHNLDPELSQREHIPLQVGVQNPSLSMELAEAKLHRSFGETDALLQVLQNGTREALAPEEPVVSTWEELSARQKNAIETLRRERAERLQNIRRTRSLSAQKQLSLLSNKDLPTWELDLPSKRREYLQQLRKDIVETSRSPESASTFAHSPSNIELMLKDYQQAREEAKVEIAQARDRLRERTEQEKLRIRQQIISQLLREEEKLQTLAHSSSLCISSSGSLSSGVTSGYNSNPALSVHLQCPEGLGDSKVPDSRDTWIGDWQGRSTVRNSQLYLEGSAWKSLASEDLSPYHSGPSQASFVAGHRSNGCCYPSSLSSLGTCYSSSYKDLAKHIVDTSMADVMAACSDNLHNLFSRQATAGWNYQGEEQQVQLYYKEFSSTRHGFLGAGVVFQPLSHVWAAVSDPTLWPLYHKPIQTARLHQRVTNNISLVYLVCDTTLCALKQLRDFCCVCVEAKEGHLSIMAAQSVYDTSMPRPSRKMVRGEILPSAWVLQPVIMEGKEITRVIFLAQVELGAPGFPPHLLSSFIKQQPLVVAKLASFLGS